MSNELGLTSSSNWFTDIFNTISEYFFEPIYDNVILPMFGSPLPSPLLQLAAPEPAPSVSPTPVPTSTPSAVSMATTLAPSAPPAQTLPGSFYCQKGYIKVNNFCIPEPAHSNSFASVNQSFISESPTPTPSTSPSFELESYTPPEIIEPQINSSAWVTDGIEAMTSIGNTIINGTAYGVSETLRMGASLAENTTFTQSLADLLKAGATVVEEHPLAITCALAATTTLIITGLAYKKGYFSGRKTPAAETEPTPEGPNNLPRAQTN